MVASLSPRTLLPALALVAALAGCSADVDEGTTDADPSASASQGTAVAPSGTPTDVITGLDVPWSIVFSGTTALVSERDSGKIIEIDADGKSRTVGRIDGVVPQGEGGLLGLAIDDDELFTYSSGSDGNRIERFPLRGTVGSFSLGSPETILDDLPSASNHNGGRIAFGPDGMLYASVGDAGDSGSAQDLNELSGKILRMTPDGDVPADNPFAGSLVYSYGHRNVQGLAWASDGTMFATEFGQDTWDELNIIEAGANYGWPEVEGKGGGDGFTDPVQVWNPDDASPSGLAIIDDTLFIANLRGEVLRVVPAAEPSRSAEYFAQTYGRLRAVAAAPDGSLWFLTNNTDGRGSPKSGDDRILSVPLSGR
ncbi:PQQ-dependent sugar dehydrogenase [soil metagenome]